MPLERNPRACVKSGVGVMTARFPRTGWTGSFFGWLALGSALASPLAVLAQSPGTGPAGFSVPRNYTNKTSFSLPIQIDPRFLAATREVVLYGRTPNTPWEKKQSVPPGTQNFPCRVMEDGEYWYSVVTVNSSGKPVPEDVTKEPPAVIVIVDTTPPTAQVKPTTLPGGELVLECTLQDANPDYKTLQMQFRGTDQVWHNLMPVPTSTNLFRVPDPQVLNLPLRCTAADQAKNVATNDITLPRIPQQQPADVQLAQQGRPNPVPSGLVDPQTSFRSSLPQIPDPVVPVSNSYNNVPVQQPLPLSKVPAGNFNPAPKAPMENAFSTGSNQAPRPLPSGNIVPESNAPAAANSPYSPQNPAGQNSYPMTQVNNSEYTPSAQPVFPKAGNGDRQLINTRLASVQYRIDQVGPSGVSKVDIWVKGGQEKGWQRMASDIDRKTPAEVMLPGDGMYGIRLAVTNGNGFGGQPPLPGDVPDYWVEVDTTPPVVQIQSVDPLTSGGNIDIRWNASDKNLGSEPIQLSYANRPEGPWYPIAPRLKNEGQFSWQFPREAGGQFYIRLEVTDEAGNVARAQPPSPIVLDLTEPRAVVVGINGVNQQ
jgi:hypothetical protein